MDEKTQTLTIRLLEATVEPKDAVRTGVVLEDFVAIEGAKIAKGKIGGEAPNWTNFLALSKAEADQLYQRFAFGLVMLKVSGRWFAVSFGLGHTKLLPEAVEQDFGLRVVLNSVAHDRLRSADLRTPDSNTLSRRAQTSRRSDRSAFDIDPERDIVRGLMGEPKDQKFATKVSGSDALSIRRKCTVDQLPGICSEALTISKKSDYTEHFSWIDQIKHVRDQDLLDKLDAKLVKTVNDALKVDPEDVDEISLAFPDIYDPDKGVRVRFYGYRSSNHYPDLEIANYLKDLHDRGVAEVSSEDLRKHSVQQCDDDGKPDGPSHRMNQCFVLETEIEGRLYCLSAGRWYAVDKSLSKEVQDYFGTVGPFALPHAIAGDNEQSYNARVAATEPDYFCLDAKPVKPSDASSPIEVCDFLKSSGELVHIKNKAESSRLSHLFNQGVASATILKRDPKFRDKVRNKIIQLGGGPPFSGLIAGSTQNFNHTKHSVVFGVIVNTGKKPPKLPFFSLITFRHACRRIREEMGYDVRFAWIIKPSAGAAKKVLRKKP